MKQILAMLAAVLVGGCASTPKPTTNITSEKLIADPILEKEIRRRIKKPTGELTKADLEKVTTLYLSGNQLTEVPKGLEKLTKLTLLYLSNNQLADVTGLEKLTQLKKLYLAYNPALTKAQIDQLKKALPNCKTTATPRSNRPHSSP